MSYECRKVCTYSFTICQPPLFDMQRVYRKKKKHHLKKTSLEKNIPDHECKIKRYNNYKNKLICLYLNRQFKLLYYVMGIGKLYVVRYGNDIISCICM